MAAPVTWARVDRRAASIVELARVHAPAYLESLEALRGESGYLDADTYVAPRSVEAAYVAAGTTVTLAKGSRSCAPQGTTLALPKRWASAS